MCLGRSVFHSDFITLYASIYRKDTKMRRKLLIPCPNCNGGESKYFKTEVICPYCKGTKQVDILNHHAVLGITDERNVNVREFLNGPRFQEYLIAKHRM